MCSKIDFVFIHDPISRHISKIFAGIDKIIYQYWRNRCRFWWNRIPVLTNHTPAFPKFYTSIGEIVYRYWCEIIYWYWRNPIPVLTNSYNCIDQIVYHYWKKANSFPWYTISSIQVGIWFRKYPYTILSLPVYNADIWFRQYRYTISEWLKDIHNSYVCIAKF